MTIFFIVQRLLTKDRFAQIISSYVKFFMRVGRQQRSYLAYTILRRHR